MGTLSAGPVCVSVSPVAVSVGLVSSGDVGCCLPLVWLGVLTYSYLVLPCGSASYTVGMTSLSLLSTVCSLWLLYLLACQSADPSSSKLKYLEIMQMVSFPKYLSVKLSLQEVSQLTLSSEQGTGEHKMRSQLSQRWLRTSAYEIPSVQRERDCPSVTDADIQTLSLQPCRPRCCSCSHHCGSASLLEECMWRPSVLQEP